MADVFEDKLETSLRALREAKTRAGNYVGGTVVGAGKMHKLTKEEIVERLTNGIKMAPAALVWQNSANTWHNCDRSGTNLQNKS